MLSWEEKISLDPPPEKDYRQFNDYWKRELASARYGPSIGYPKQSGEPWKYKHTAIKMNLIGGIYVLMYIYKRPSVSKGWGGMERDEGRRHHRA